MINNTLADRLIAYSFKSNALNCRGLVSRIAVTLLLLTSTSNARADLFSAAGDFSSTTNPNGVWTYGESDNLSMVAGFQAFQNAGKDLADAPPADLLDAWYNNPVNPSLLEIPAVLHNGTGNIITFTNPGTATVTYLPGELGFHPGAFGERGVVRFTAPFDAFYSINSAFRPIDEAATTEIQIVRNGFQLFTGNVDPGVSISYASSFFLTQGEVLDFAVGARGNSLSDTTGLSVSITAVPEPASLGLCSGIALLAGFRRLKRLYLAA